MWEVRKLRVAIPLRRLTLPKRLKRQLHEDDMILPVYGKITGAETPDLQQVAKRRRLHRPVRSTFPAYDVTYQLTYFRRPAELPVFRGGESCRVWFWHGYKSRAFHHLYIMHKKSRKPTQNTRCATAGNVPQQQCNFSTEWQDISLRNFLKLFWRFARVWRASTPCGRVKQWAIKKTKLFVKHGCWRRWTSSGSWLLRWYVIDEHALQINW